MWSGEDVIADVKDNLTEIVVISNPIVAVPSGNGQIGFAPWSPLLKGRDEEIEITKKYIVYIAETQQEIEDQYREMFSVLKTPSKKLVL
jgi:hypothetical protein